MATHIQLGEYAAALIIYESLPEDAQNNLRTRFLLFRLALRGWNQALAAECVAFFAAGEDKDEARDALYACIREAQSAGDRLCTVSALKAAAESWRDEKVVQANLPSLLRCAIRLLQLVSEDKSSSDRESFASDIVYLFKLGTSNHSITAWVSYTS